MQPQDTTGSNLHTDTLHRLYESVYSIHAYSLKKNALSGIKTQCTRVILKIQGVNRSYVSFNNIIFTFLVYSQNNGSGNEKELEMEKTKQVIHSILLCQKIVLERYILGFVMWKLVCALCHSFQPLRSSLLLKSRILGHRLFSPNTRSKF